MNDLIIFVFGCFVTVIVASSVGLLMWGAANEPEDGEQLPKQKSSLDSVRVTSTGSSRVN